MQETNNEVDGSNIYNSSICQMRVLNLDSNLLSIMGPGSMNLCKRSASKRHWIELSKDLKKTGECAV